jgi:hypothetical protein
MIRSKLALMQRVPKDRTVTIKLPEGFRVNWPISIYIEEDFTLDDTELSIEDNSTEKPVFDQKATDV